MAVELDPFDPVVDVGGMEKAGTTWQEDLVALLTSNDHADWERAREIKRSRLPARLY